MLPGVLKLMTLNLLVFRGFSVTDLLEADVQEGIFHPEKN